MTDSTDKKIEYPKPKANILVLGASGMLGSALFSELPKVSSQYKTIGTFRGQSPTPILHNSMTLIPLEDVFDKNALSDIMRNNDISVVINAIGLIKQLGGELKKSDYVKINSWLPHYLVEICDEFGARFIEVSTDCVFTGAKGLYSEKDVPDARDIYGVSKLLGEVTDNPNALTIRTSIIGHESGRAASLIDWFLSTSGQVKGFDKAIFSGFPTAYLAQIIGQYILPNKTLSGLYHISAKPIDKYSLLCLVAQKYQHNVKLVPNSDLVIDRSLDSSRFMTETGFVPPEWSELIDIMKETRPVWKSDE